MKTYIGCSGFHYAGWRNRFYPGNLPKKDWLSYYSEHFNTVEINNTFYKMPEEKNLRNWMDKTPTDFKFTIKANRYFTHQKKLTVDYDFRDRFHAFDETLKVLGSKLGCVLWQLPGNLHKNAAKLQDLVSLLDARTHHVVEFRHISWFDESIYSLLEKHKISFCMVSAPGNLPEEVISTAKTAYLRFHGKNNWYNYYYSEQEMEGWHKRLKKLKGPDRLYAYFNNDHNAWAVENARMLKKLFS